MHRGPSSSSQNGVNHRASERLLKISIPVVRIRQRHLRLELRYRRYSFESQPLAPKIVAVGPTCHPGQRYEGVPGEGGFTVMSFSQHAVRIPEFDASLDSSDPEFMETADLIKSNRLADHAEFQWRLSIPIAAVLLVLLAFPLSVTNPHQGRFAKFGLAIAIYLIYSNLLILAESWVADGKLPTIPGLFVVHLALAVVVAFLLFRQHNAT